jgi:7-cyano-7-deazaguanine synthase
MTISKGNGEGNGSGEKVSTLVSGGLDSAVLVAWAKEKKYDQLAFFVNYGQDNLDRELASARVNTQRVGVPLEVVDISPLRNSFVGRFPFPINLYDCEVKNPLGQITTFALSALVAGIGVLADRYTLLMGIHHTDIEHRPVLKKNMASLEDVVGHVVSSFTEQRFSLLLPFRDTPRLDVIRVGIDLGVDFQNTWSCHEDTNIPCGECEGCRERVEAFELAGMADPQLGKGVMIPVKARVGESGAVRI